MSKKKTMRRLAVVIGICFCFASQLLAVEQPLSFDRPIVELLPTIDDTSLSFVVIAKNSSGRPLEVAEYRGGCGCITFSSPIRTLASEDSMSVSVIFDIKDYTGPQKRTLSILTTSTESQELVKSSFQLICDVPTAIQFNTKAAIWLYGQPPSTQEIKVVVKPEYTIFDLCVEDIDKSRFIKVDQCPSDDGRQLILRVTPVSTDIETVSPAERANLQIPYVVKYKTQNGTIRYERFWAVLTKRPEKKGPTDANGSPTAK